jgi:transposase
VKQSVAYQALQKIAKFYNADTDLKGLSSEKRLQKRQEVIKPLVEEFFAWVKLQQAECVVPPQSKTGKGLQYCINQEKYLKVFLTNGDVPIDNSASERAIRTFCLGKKNWMFHNSAKGAGASALVYSISETAKLDYLMPWSESLPEECRKPRRL